MNKKLLSVLLICLSFLLLTACGSTTDNSTGDIDSGADLAGDTSTNNATIYIGMEDYFTEVAVTVPDVDFADNDSVVAYLGNLVAAISTETGWTINCEISSYKSVGVMFEGANSIYSGPPDPQNDAYFVYDAYQLNQTILDSIQKTIQMALTGEGGDPDALEIYYSGIDDTELIFPDLGVYVPISEAYSGLVAVQ